MKALVYDGVEALTYKDVATPTPDASSHLVRIEAVGICGSDMHAYLGHDDRRPAPLILGHEGAGTIEGGPIDGRRVTINPLVTCGVCAACLAGRENLCPHRQIISMPPRQGAFAQYVTMPEKNLIDVPDDVPLHKAALAEPLAVGWHAVRLGLEALPAQRARETLIIGGGAIGVAAALALKAMGQDAITLIEPNAARRAYLVDQCDLTAVEDAEGTFELVIDAVGYSSTRQTASARAHPGGVILHIGLGEDLGGLDIRRMTLQEITFIGTYTYTAQDFRDTADAIFDGRLGSLDWTEERALSAGSAAFADIRAGRIAAPKVILAPWS